MDIKRYDIYAENSYDYEGEIIGNYLEVEEDSNGDWVRAEDADALIKRIQELEAANRSLRYNNADDWEPTIRFFRD